MTDVQRRTARWLSRAYNADRDSKCMLDRISELNSRVTNMVIATDGQERVSSSGSQDKMADTIIKIVELKEQYYVMFNDYLDAAKEVLEACNMVEDKTEREILLMRFIDGMKFYDIAYRMNYTERQVINIYKRALDGVANKKHFS